MSWRSWHIGPKILSSRIITGPLVRVAKGNVVARINTVAQGYDTNKMRTQPDRVIYAPSHIISSSESASIMSPTIVDLTESSPTATRLSEELPIRNALIAAITDAEPERLRVTLQRICNFSPDAFGIAKSLLLIPEEQVKYKTIDRKNGIDDDADQDEEDGSEPSDSEEDTESSDDTNGENDDSGDEEEEEEVPQIRSNGVAAIGVKRLRSRFATCTNCSEEFDVTENGRYSCVWHPGIFETRFSEYLSVA